MFCGDPSAAASLVPVVSGRAYRVASPPGCALVTPELAEELQRVLDRFAREAGFNDRHRVEVFFRPGVVGHHKVGRAADIYAVGGTGLDHWKRLWDEATEGGGGEAGQESRRGFVSREASQNLGWRLYKALQQYGRWSQPPGYPVQLFGPWTRTEGPWRLISDRLLNAHRDHIHVAK